MRSLSNDLLDLNLVQSICASHRARNIIYFSDERRDLSHKGRVTSEIIISYARTESTRLNANFYVWFKLWTINPRSIVSGSFNPCSPREGRPVRSTLSYQRQRYAKPGQSPQSFLSASRFLRAVTFIRCKKMLKVDGTSDQRCGFYELRLVATASKPLTPHEQWASNF